ncbi:MAG: hypothetical protein GY909_11615 [Oligoflexia bacterium]|nr:hypothetical protein [Oligoflexia bacterium]
MDKVIQIFTQLGVDSTIFAQFAIFTVLFFVLKYVWFNKLLSVIELRENSTTKRDSNANEKFNEADKLAQKYDDEIQDTYAETFKNVNSKKEALLKEEGVRIREVEGKLATEFEAKRAELEEDYKAKKSQVLSSVDSLSGDLVNKLLN